MAIERARQAERRAAEGKGLELEQGDVFTGDLGDLLIVANGAQHAPKRRVDQAIDEEEEDDDRADHNAKIEEIEEVGPKFGPKGAGNAGEAIGAIGNPQLVRHDDPEALGKAKRDNGQVVAAHIDGDERYQHADKGR